MNPSLFLTMCQVADQTGILSLEWQLVRITMEKQQDTTPLSSLRIHENLHILERKTVESHDYVMKAFKK